MINAVMFDLDGTLVQSEKLKALSYAIAAQRLRNLPELDSRAIEAYREILGPPGKWPPAESWKPLSLHLSYSR